MAESKVDPYLHPPVDPELLEIMRAVYARYTGYQVAAVVALIRRELDSAHEPAE